ncbi:tubby C-terminal domain-like protein [Evansella cellulosilytica]|uniref:Tubby C-terminal domain-containing protein n=1 Tax=Evansella cellulosilytica (strain ATCC 21833 / DSM 2522 / FERM P-1141 / JCM 9156 / N-4) TaxID=649639 RepID=E6TWE0_EVAC2|nr:hypothetical protein [Evansella cellulosilytica]ADU32203.1 hypothetical protein Bcell_3970 [Evansella cellulosilytica DSM 2522]
MATYKYRRNFLVLSTNPINVYDENGHVAYKIKKIHTSKLEKYLIIKLYNFKVLDKNNNTLVFSEMETPKFTRPKWDIHYGNSLENTFTFQCVSKINTHPRYIFNYEGRSFEIKKNLGDKTTYIYSGARKIATFNYKYKGISLIRPTFYLNINDESQLPPDILLCLLYSYEAVLSRN